MSLHARWFKPLIFLVLIGGAPVSAGEVAVAVAANFTSAMNQLAPLFEQKTGHRLKTSFGSTGKLYAQILHGAPFEVFLAADDQRSADLIEQGHAVAGTHFIYAFGRLALWSGKPDFIDAHGAVLKTGRFDKLAIANPMAAPYGAAAVAAMQALGVYDRLEAKLVQGENIAQTLQFVHSGNAELGFVAYAQVVSLQQAERGSYWLVPETLHQPIRQEAMLLRPGASDEAARAFLEFLKSPEATAAIRELGYAAGEAN